MRLSLTLLSAVAISAAVSAQSNNEFWNYASSAAQDATTFTSRYGVAGADSGYVYKGFTNYRAIGNPQTAVAAGTTDAGEFIGYTGIIQDQLGNTPEEYVMFVTLQDPANPGNPPSDPVDAVGGFINIAPQVLATSATPTLTPPSTATGPVAWRVTFTSATPVSGVEADQPLWIGYYMGANALWTGDGASAQGAWYTAGTTGENPNANAPANSWFESITGGVAQGVNQPSSNFNNPHFGLLTQNTVFEAGADIDPTFDRNGASNGDYGIAGRYPEQQVRGDGIAFRITDANSEGALAAIVMDLTPVPGPVNVIPGIPGYVGVLSPGFLSVPLATGPITGGVFESIGATSLFPFPNPFPLPTGTTVGTQGVVLDLAAGALKLANVCNISEL